MKTLQKLIVFVLLISPIFAFAKTTKAKVVKKPATAIIKVLPVPNTTSTNAQGSASSAQDAKMGANRVMPPINNGSKTYTFDETAVKTLANQTSSLLRVNCDGLQVLKDLGFTENTPSIFSLGVSNGDFDYNFDVRNCTLWGSKTNQQWTNSPVTEAQALKFAKDFMASKYLAKKIFSQYGNPIVIAKNNNSVRPMYDGKMGGSISAETAVPFSGITIDPNDTGDVNPQYVSFSILFPYVIDGKGVYNNYGNRAGITVEVTAEGVSSINAQLLPFKGAIRNADKMTAEDMSTYIKKGGNNQYRGSEETVNLGKPEQILVLFTLRRNNINETYLSSGIKFSTKLKPDQWTQQAYEMTLSDYRIGNNNYGY
ncbi:MAG: hypothetical protein WCO66_00075 [Candidatus Absconditabacteria bacterium]